LPPQASTKDGKSVTPDQEALESDDQDSARRILESAARAMSVFYRDGHCVRSLKISNGDKIGPSCSTMRRRTAFCFSGMS